MNGSAGSRTAACPRCGVVLVLPPGAFALPHHLTPQRGQCPQGGRSLR